MPVPVVGIALGISFYGVISDIITADSNDKKARQIYYEAFNDVEDAAREARIERDKTVQKLLKLSNRKKGIMRDSISKFVNTFQKVANINFTKNDLAIFTSKSVLPLEMDTLKKMVNISGMGLTDRQLLSTLVFHGFLKGALGAISGTIRKESEINLQVAYMTSDMADVATSNNKTAKVAIAAIGVSADRFSKLLANLNALLIRSITHIDEIIEQKGMAREKYLEDEKKDIMNCFNLAGTIKDLLEQPLFDTNGIVSKQAIKAMATGEASFLELEKIAHS